MKTKLERQRTLKRAHQLADRANFLIRHIVTSIKNKKAEPYDEQDHGT